MKKYTLEELTDKYIGEKGSPEREQFKYDREAYTEGKAKFVKQITERAKALKSKYKTS